MFSSFLSFFRIPFTFRLKTSHACKAKLTGKRQQDGSYSYKNNGAEHTHIIDVRDAEVRKRLTAAKSAAASSNNPTRELYADFVMAAPEAVITNGPNANAFGKMIRKQREGELSKLMKMFRKIRLFCLLYFSTRWLL